jgi:hypothetical protein
MRFDPQAGITKGGSDARRRRQHGRLPQDTLKSNLGDVLNLSAGGMRVICKDTPPTRIHVSLEGHKLPGPLLAELAWTKKRGMFKHEVGYKFVNISQAVADHLTRIAGTNRFRRAI